MPGAHFQLLRSSPAGPLTFSPLARSNTTCARLPPASSRCSRAHADSLPSLQTHPFTEWRDDLALAEFYGPDSRLQNLADLFNLPLADVGRIGIEPPLYVDYGYNIEFKGECVDSSSSCSSATPTGLPRRQPSLTLPVLQQLLRQLWLRLPRLRQDLFRQGRPPRPGRAHLLRDSLDPLGRADRRLRARVPCRGELQSSLSLSLRRTRPVTSNLERQTRQGPSADPLAAFPPSSSRATQIGDNTWIGGGVKIIGPAKIGASTSSLTALGFLLSLTDCVHPPPSLACAQTAPSPPAASSRATSPTTLSSAACPLGSSSTSRSPRARSTRPTAASSSLSRAQRAQPRTTGSGSSSRGCPSECNRHCEPAELGLRDSCASRERNASCESARRSRVRGTVAGCEASRAATRPHKPKELDSAAQLARRPLCREELQLRRAGSSESAGGRQGEEQLAGTAQP